MSATRDSVVAKTNDALGKLPTDVSRDAWEGLHSSVVELDNEAQEWEQSGGPQGVSRKTTALVQVVQTLAEKAAEGSLDQAADGAEIAGALNTLRILPNYFQSLPDPGEEERGESESAG